MKLILRILLAILLIVGVTCHAETLNGRIVQVADGDTVTLLTSEHVQYKVRLMGIDAPEKKQDFGLASKKTLSDMTYDQQVKVEYNKKDRYGRIVGKIFVSGKDINLEQVKLVMAWHYKKYATEQDVNDISIYANTEYEAQRDKIGLWSVSNSMPPRDFRKKRRLLN